MNVVILKGRLTADPEVKEYGKGKNSGTVAKYTLAVQKQGSDDEANFIQCTCFNKLADFAEKYLEKGKEIAVEGSLDVSSWDDEDDVRHWSYTVIVNRHEFCGSKKDEDDKKSRRKER